MEKEKLLQKYMHLSVDDTYFLLKELNEGSYGSIYEHKIINFFKNLHDKYGAVFSLYCFYHSLEADEWIISDMTDKYKEEFKDAASWLKFGFHSNNSAMKYDETITPDEALKHYDTVIGAINNFAGPASIDRIPRIHFFAATIEQIRNWKNTDYGIKGLLAADDNRESNYYLNASERNHLSKYSDYFEEKENIYFLKTNMRLENVPNSYEALGLAKQNPLLSGQQDIKVIFTHEKFLYTDEILQKIEDCCRWAMDNNFTFAYPMDNIRK